LVAALRAKKRERIHVHVFVEEKKKTHTPCGGNVIVQFGDLDRGTQNGLGPLSSPKREKKRVRMKERKTNARANSSKEAESVLVEEKNLVIPVSGREG